MIADRHRASPQRSGAAAAGYALATRQITGVFFILLLFAFAWLLVRLPLPPAYTLLVGYGVGLALFVPGARLALHGRMCGKTLLGGGAACVFLTTTSILFETSRTALPVQFPLHPYGGLLICAALLALFATLAWRARSQSNSLLTVALTLYLFQVVFPQLSLPLRGLLLFLGAVLLIVWICLWTTYRSGRLFTHIALFLGYAALYGFGRVLGDAGGVSFGMVTVALLLLYVVMTALVVDHVFRDHARHRVFLFFALANTLFYATAGFLLFAADYTGYLWIITGTVFVISALAGFVLYLVHGDGALISMYTATAIIALLACFLLPLAPGVRLGVLAAGCVAPALLSRRRNDRLLQLTEFALLAVVMVASFALDARAGYVLSGLFSIPERWAWLLAAAGMLCFTSRLHTGWIFEARPGSDETRTVDSPGYHPEHELLALVCALTAALMITLHTILIRGDSEMLPVVLAAQGMVFLGLGMALFTPALAVAGLTPLFAAHALYYAFPYLAASAAWTAPQASFQQMTVLFCATLAAALYTDRLLLSRLGARASSAEKMLAAIPYLPALALALFAAHETIPGHYHGPALGAAGLLLLTPLAPRRNDMPGMTALGFGLVVLSLAAFFLTPRADTLSAYALPWYLPLLGVYVACLAALERLAARGWTAGAWQGRLLSHGVIGLLALVGAVGIYRWNSGDVYLPALFGFALLLAYFGWLFRVRAYYHLALTVVAVGAFMLLYGGSS